MENKRWAINRCLAELGSSIEGLQNEYDRLHSDYDELKKNHLPHTLSVDSVNAKCTLEEGEVSDIPGKVDHLTPIIPVSAWGAAPTEVQDFSTLQGDAKPELTSAGTLVMPGRDTSLVTLAASRLGMLKKKGPHARQQEEPENEEKLNFSDALREEVLEHFQIPKGKTWSLRLLVDGYLFRLIVMVAIIANTIHTGVRVDFHMKNNYLRVVGESPEEDWHYVADIAFTSFFGLELLLRLAAEKRAFFTGANLNTNIVDTALVILGLVEIAGTAGVGFGFILRIFRMFRITRLVRLVKTVKLLRSLRTMIFSLINAWTMLVWASVVIVITIFMFGVLFGGGIVTYYERVDLNDSQQVETARIVHDEFGSLYQMMTALFCSITGGNDWMQYATTLRHIHWGEFYFVMFALYISFSVVGMLNVVTGLFVDSAVCTRTQDEIVQDYNDDYARTAQEVRNIFGEADSDESASISFHELTKHLKKPWVKAYFAGLDIDPSEAQIIFALMDIDGSEVLTLDEFVEGVMKMKGGAKNIDVLSMMFDQARFNLRFNTLCSFLEDELRQIKKVIAPSLVAPMRMFHNSETTLAEVNKFSKIRYPIDTPLEGLSSGKSQELEEIPSGKTKSSRLAALMPVLT